MAIGDICKLYLENITSAGDAFGRLEGKTFFVPGGAPNETVLCRVIEEHNTWSIAELLEIIEPSPVRVESICAFYGKCGGCNLAHIDYNAQIQIKENILKETFLRIGGIVTPPFKVFPSPTWEYRNRMQFHCLREKAKSDSARFGLKSRSGKDIIAVSDCPVAVPGIRNAFKSICLPPGKDRFNVFSKDDVLLSEGGWQKGKIKLFDKEIKLDAGLFFQSNVVMLEKLIFELRKIAEVADRSLPMADLYCGIGTFASFLGDLFPSIILAEENKAAVSLARENLRSFEVEFFALRDTEWQNTFLRQTPQSGGGGGIGFAVVDPPRAGLSPKLVNALALGDIPLLAYVSCDAASLARDAKILVKGGYELKELMFFDFYPQTAHVESLAVFKR
ncbi:MAG: class I SAM-dependent RNA methyltransferase [Treponema sp.]|nr:class I SAM-dependent RNA methyltransferase [Treponema sp.]